MFPELSFGQWFTVLVGANIAGLVLWATGAITLQYFFGNKLTEIWNNIFFHVAIAETIVWMAFWSIVLGILAIAFVLVCMIVIGVPIAIIAGIWMLLTWPWYHRHQRLFWEYHSWDPAEKDLDWFRAAWYGKESKLARRMRLSMARYARSLQDAIDKLHEVEAKGYSSFDERQAVEKAKQAYHFAEYSARRNGYRVKPTHLDYLAKRRREKIQRQEEKQPKLSLVS